MKKDRNRRSRMPVTLTAIESRLTEQALRSVEGGPLPAPADLETSWQRFFEEALTVQSARIEALERRMNQLQGGGIL